MLKKYGMLGCKSIDVPLDKNFKLRADLGAKIDYVNMYRSMVGSLIYLTITRPDLSYAVGLVSQFMQQPTKPHLDCKTTLGPGSRIGGGGQGPAILEVGQRKGENGHCPRPRR